MFFLGAMVALDGSRKGERELFNDGMRTLIGSMRDVNRVMEGMQLSKPFAKPQNTLSINANVDMWKHSKPKDYNNFRTFIFGITKQSMFPNGVIYEGVSEDPMFFRGESGANDSIVMLPCAVQISGPLTELVDSPLRQSPRDRDAGHAFDGDSARFSLLPPG